MAITAFSAQNSCAARSGPQITPVVELYTSEGCSSCPPADKWASTLKGKGWVVQAFHVGYWDYIGWTDRFAAPAYTQRQREAATRNRLGSIYTPQVLFNGRDWRAWPQLGRAGGAEAAPTTDMAPLSISLQQLGPDQFEASVAAVTAVGQQPVAWSAYWTVTEHGHRSKVQAGENAGEFLQHDFVVRQYIHAGEYRSSPGAVQKLILRSILATPGHARQINLVLSDPASGNTLQALSLQCSAGS